MSDLDRDLAEVRREIDSMERLPGYFVSVGTSQLAKWRDAIDTHHAEIARDREDDRQRLPAGWRIEVRECDGVPGLCIFGPEGAGAFVVHRDTDHKSDIRHAVIKALQVAMKDSQP